MSPKGESITALARKFEEMSKKKAEDVEAFL